MNLQELLNYILYIVLTAILPIMAKYAVNLIKSKIKESNIIFKTTQNQNASRLIEDALSDVMDAVLYVNQVYTDSLKASGCFDDKAQKEAFERAYSKAKSMISEEAKFVIEELYSSFDQWLRFKIEASVNIAKNTATQ